MSISYKDKDKMRDCFTIRRIPLASLYRQKPVISLECGECNARARVDYLASGWRGREGRCPVCGKSQRLRPVDLRRTLEKSFRNAVQRIDKKDNPFWTDILAFTIARAAMLLRPLLMVTIVHFRHQRIGHYIQNTLGFLWRMEDDGYGEALLFAMPPNPKTESNHYFREQVGRRFILTPAAIPAFHLVEKKPGYWKKLVDAWKKFRLRSKKHLEQVFVLADRKRPISHAVELAGEPSNEFAWVFPYWIDTASRPPFISFSGEERKKAEKWLKEKGLDPAAPFVCFCARDSSYLDTVHPGHDWSYHSFRDMDADTLVPAMEWLADQGVVCFRMGKHPKKRLPSQHPGVVDYASLHQDDFMDVYLMSNCLFGVGSGAGVDLLFFAAKRWYLQINSTWFYHPAIIARAANYWMIAKKFWSHDRQKYLSYKEIYALGVDYLPSSDEYLKHGIDLVNNTPEEILAAVKEIYARRTGTWTESREEGDIKNYFTDILVGAYPKYRNMIKNESRLCTSFLRANPGFLAESGIRLE